MGYPPIYKCISIAITILVLLAGCSKSEPIKLGIVAGLSGRNVDLGEGGRNGALLAIEQSNQAGGIHGRLIEAVIKDDGNAQDSAQKAARDLIAEKVALIIGPFNSAMSAAMLEETNPAQMLLFSPTASAQSFAEKDDYFIRLNWTTRDNARLYAKWIAQRNQLKTVALAYDLQNAIFSESWVKEFRTAYEALGGKVAALIAYDAHITAPYSSISSQMLKSQADALLFVSNSVDMARFAQQVRQHDPSIALFSSEWAEVDKVIDLGGKAIEDLMILRTIDTHSQAPSYLNFVNAYKTRFRQEPSYTSVAAYDATRIALTALKQQKPKQTLKDAILKNSPYPGLQKEIHLDAFGDAQSRALYGQVKNGEIVILP